MTDGMDPSQTSTPNRLESEIRGLGRCLMPHNENSHLRKSMTLLLVTLWVGWSIGRAQGAIGTGDVVLAGYTAYQLFSGATIYAFARLHRLEVQNLLGGNVLPTGQNDSVSDGDDDE